MIPFLQAYPAQSKTSRLDGEKLNIPMTKLRDLPVSKKINTLLGLTILLVIIGLAGALFNLLLMKSDSALIDIAGKNRMLSQRIAFYSLLLVKGEPVREELLRLVGTVDHHLEVLSDGGRISLREKTFEVPPLPDDLNAELTLVRNSWEQFRRRVESLHYGNGPSAVRVADTSAYSAAVSGPIHGVEHLRYIETNAAPMLGDFDKLVGTMVEKAESRHTALKIFLSLIASCTLAILALCVFMVTKSVQVPIQILQENTQKLSLGDLSAGVAYKRDDDVGRTIQSLDQLRDKLKSGAQFAYQIANGNFDSEFLPAGEKDELGTALLTMRERLREVSREDRKRNWTTEGLSRFSEILRNDQNDVAALSHKILVELIKYIGANQGGIFLINDENLADEHLALVATYAWDKQKFLSKKVYPGEGLLGQAWLEKEIIYLKEVPPNYVNITSGLGKANPRVIVILPLKLNDELLGVVELASFREYEDFEREFLLRLAENIASTLASAKVNDRTKRLLEQSQQQAEELRAQEEEMRQNMEELQATQEEMTRKNKETENRVTAIDASGIASIEFNLDGTILTANENFLRLMEYQLHEIKGKHHRIFVTPTDAASDEYARFWSDLSNGIPRPGKYSRVTRSGRLIHIEGSYSIMRNTDGKPYQILKLASDITELVVARENMARKAMEAENILRALDESGIASVEFGLDGQIIYANQNFLSLMEYRWDELVGKHHRIFVDSSDAQSDTYAGFWKDLANGVPRPGRYERITKSGRKVVISGSYSILKDSGGRPNRILKLATVVDDGLR